MYVIKRTTLVENMRIITKTPGEKKKRCGAVFYFVHIENNTFKHFMPSVQNFHNNCEFMKKLK